MGEIAGGAIFMYYQKGNLISNQAGTDDLQLPAPRVTAWASRTIWRCES